MLKFLPYRAWMGHAGGIALAAFVLACSTVVSGQGPGVDNSKGLPDNKIEGRLFFPGPASSAPIRVRLMGDRGELSTNTDRDGRFFFRGLRPGRYTLTVDGGVEYKVVSQIVDVMPVGAVGMPSEFSQMATVNIRLQWRESSDSAALATPIMANIPSEASKLYTDAVNAAQAGDRKKAIEMLKSAIAIHPQFAQALNGLGVQYMKLGELDKAAEAFVSALKIEPELFILRLNYGIVLFQLKKYAEADNEFNLALKKDDKSPTGHFYKGRALISLGRFEDAETELRRVITLGGEEVAMAHRYLGGIYLERGDTRRAVSELEAYLKLMPKAKEAERVRDLIKQLEEKSGKPE